MDAHDDGFLYGVANLAGDFVCPAHAFFQGNVVAFGDQEFGIDASELEVLYDCSGNLAVVLVLPEASVGRAFARGIGRQSHCIGVIVPADEPVGNVYVMLRSSYVAVRCRKSEM